MEWNDDVIKQCPKPTGKFRRIVAEEMNKSHSELWKWGLGHISIGNNFIILDVGCGGGGSIKLLNRLSTNDLPPEKESSFMLDWKLPKANE